MKKKKMKTAKNWNGIKRASQLTLGRLVLMMLMMRWRWWWWCRWCTYIYSLFMEEEQQQPKVRDENIYNHSLSFIINQNRFLINHHTTSKHTRHRHCRHPHYSSTRLKKTTTLTSSNVTQIFSTAFTIQSHVKSYKV